MGATSLKRLLCNACVGVMLWMVSFSPAQAAQDAADAPSAKNAKVLFACPRLADKDKMTLDAMTQGEDGWFYRLSSDMKPEFRLMGEASGYMTRLVNAMKQRGTSMVFMSVPPRGIAGYASMDKSNPDQMAYPVQQASDSFQGMLASLRKTGLIVPDLMAASQASTNADVNFFFRRDHHWTSVGAQKAAEILTASLKDNPVYKQQTLSKFVTKPNGTGQMKHTMAMEIQRLCDGDIPAESFPLFTTSMEATGADALFGDAGGGSPSVLVGSSFSAQQDFNFDGAIMQATGLNIANYAISAGLLFNAITSLTNDPQFETMTPPFLIWEAPSIYDLNTDSTPAFRQIIPGVYGKCKDENVVAKGTMSVNGGAAGLLMNVPAEAKVHGSGYYLVIDSSSKGFAKFTLQLDYDDKDGEWFSVDRTQHFNNNGRFFVELDDEIESNLVQVSIDGMDKVTTNLEATLCKAPAVKAAAPVAAPAVAVKPAS